MSEQCNHIAINWRSDAYSWNIFLKNKYTFIIPTLKFCIVGFFIPGLTLIVVAGIQMAIEFLGIECSDTWSIIWICTSIGAVIAPFVFVRILNRTLSEGYNPGLHTLVYFNIIEMTFIQVAMGMFFTNGNTLCYVSDGQNGIQLVFTGWLALPFLVGLSWLFDRMRERRTQELHGK